MLQSVIVAVLALVVLFFLTGGLQPLSKRSSKVAPVLRQKRLKVHFSLRTMLIAITLMALLFGFVAWLNHTPS